MKILSFSFAIVSCLSLGGCLSSKKSGVDDLENGKYKNISRKNEPVWVSFEDTVLKIFAIQERKDGDVVDKQTETIFLFPLTNSSPGSGLKLLHSSFDLDIITIPFKFRFATAGFPAQLNTNFSGALYAGFRNDVYALGYKKNLFGEYQRRISHHGYGGGIFCGIGSTPMNPWVTLNATNIEYDGFVVITGIAAIAAINRFTFGIGGGIDHLMDKNRKLWIYTNKPWLGLTIGLNLN